MKKVTLFVSVIMLLTNIIWAQNAVTIAGNGITGYGGDGEVAGLAEFDGIRGIAVDKDGNVFIADERNNRIRKISKSGIISTIAGNGIAGYNGDGGAATAAQLNHPFSVAVDRSGNIYVADASNNRIRKVTQSGKITTFAGNGYGAETYNSEGKGTDNNGGYGGDGGPAVKAKLFFPSGVAVDDKGNVYIADNYNNRIRKVAPNGTISTVAGNGKQASDEITDIGDGKSAILAQLDRPVTVAVDKNGVIYIADMENSRIRKVTQSGKISTIAGTGDFGHDGDEGLAINAQLRAPSDLAIDKAGNVYVADWSGNSIRKITPAGRISTVVRKMNHPNGLGFDYLGNLYVGNETEIVKVDAANLSDTITQPKIAGIGFLKLGDDKDKILDTVAKVLGVGQVNPQKVDKMGEVSIFFNRENGIYQTSDTLCEISQHYIVYEIPIAGILFRKVHLVFYNNRLVSIKSDGSMDIEKAINLKYGEVEPKITTKKVTCTYTYTGASHEEEELQAITTWRDDSIICQDDLNSYFDDKCEKQHWHYFTLELKGYERKIWDCQDVRKKRKQQDDKKSLDKF